MMKNKGSAEWGLKWILSGNAKKNIETYFENR